jgi:hypothetical protein
MNDSATLKNNSNTCYPEILKNLLCPQGESAEKNINLTMLHFPLLKTGACIPVLFLLFSCAGLKPSQISAVENYTIVTKGISAIPPDIYFRVYQLRSQAQSAQLSAVIATNESAKESIEALRVDFNDKFKFIDLVDSFSYAYSIVGQYADLVHALISESYLKEFTRNKKEWETSFNGLIARYNSTSAKRVPPLTQIPPSVGSIAANIIKELSLYKKNILKMQ